jgi:hypothetical protein
VISTRHGYGNHDSEWLRAWRYRPGCRWAAHEPPLLAEQLPSGRQRLLTELGAFGHELTESAGLIFQHLAYVLPEQLRFKELYYGYRGALEQWTALQRQQVWPVRLDRFFAWVKDQSLADRVEHHGVEPLVDIDRMMRDHNQQTAMRADLEGIS